MGTSSSNPGPAPNMPLLPTWADPPLPIPIPGDQIRPIIPVPENRPRPSIKPGTNNQRFRNARTNFTHFVSSGGSDKRSLGRAIRSYIRTSSGGAGTAAKRMGASRRTAAKLVGLLAGFQSKGVSETLRTFSFERLVGQPPKQILIALTDLVCKPSGLIDESISRTAFLDTMHDLIIRNIDLNRLTVEQIGVITAQFISRSIVLSIINNIGMKFDVKAISAEQANNLLRSLNDFVFGIVRDQIQKNIQRVRNLSEQQLVSSMTRIYTIAFDMLDHQARRLK